MQQAPAAIKLIPAGARCRRRSLVVATGGLSIPKIGATDLGYRIAQQFGLPLVEQRPGLVPLTFDGADWQPYAQLAGLALPVEISTGSKKERMAFHEDLLFTHRGLSGPAVLQISSYWREGQPLAVNLAPGGGLARSAAAGQGPLAQADRQRAGHPGAHPPGRGLGQHRCRLAAPHQRGRRQGPGASLAERLARWELTPTGTEGYKKAEVTLGGVDTRALSQQTMECKTQPGLYFIGEVVDVTGWLGGYNFQWAWASAYACAGIALPCRECWRGNEERVKVHRLIREAWTARRGLVLAGPGLQAPAGQGRLKW